MKKASLKLSYCHEKIWKHTSDGFLLPFWMCLSHWLSPMVGLKRCIRCWGFSICKKLMARIASWTPPWSRSMDRFKLLYLSAKSPHPLSSICGWGYFTTKPARTHSYAGRTPRSSRKLFWLHAWAMAQAVLESNLHLTPYQGSSTNSIISNLVAKRASYCPFIPKIPETI